MSTQEEAGAADETPWNGPGLLSVSSNSGILGKNSSVDHFQKNICEVSKVELQLTNNQILSLAPDASSAAAGRKHSNTKFWRGLGRSVDALWGECQGSALYQVKVELASLTMQCSCPSRKLPCKHSLGLLLLAAADSAALPLTEPPEWVASWLAKRLANSARKQARENGEGGEAPSTVPGKSAEKRLANVKKGLESLDLWLNDLLRQGLASVQAQPVTFWEKQAARLRDAQAPALDTRVRRLAEIPNSSPNWPEKLLAEVGKLALLTHAFRHEDQLEPGMREEVRQLIGWSLTQDEVNARGEIQRDDWLMVGQVLEENERSKLQRTWLMGARSKRPAVILQFSFAGQPFAEHFAPGTRQEAELTFWPGANPQRAQVRARLSDLVPLKDELPGTTKIDQFLSDVATALSRQPWLEYFLCLLRAVTPVCGTEGTPWYIRDQDGQVLPLRGGEHWLLLALSGGHPVDLAAEWNGESLQPMGVMVDGAYTLLGRTL